MFMETAALKNILCYQSPWRRWERYDLTYKICSVKTLGHSTWPVLPISPCLGKLCHHPLGKTPCTYSINYTRQGKTISQFALRATNVLMQLAKLHFQTRWTCHDYSFNLFKFLRVFPHISCSSRSFHLCLYCTQTVKFSERRILQVLEI